MKKLSFLVLLVLFAGHFAFSQTRLGLKGGINLSNLNLDREFERTNNAKSKNKFGYQLGLVAESDLSEKLFLRPEFYFATKGYRFYRQDIDEVNTISLNYLNLPVFVGYRFNPDLAVFGGPQFGVLGPVNSKFASRDSKVDLRHLMDFYHFDFLLGTGVAYSLTPRLSADLRYTFGLNAIMDPKLARDEHSATFSRDQRHNKSLELSLNYFFRAK